MYGYHVFPQGLFIALDAAISGAVGIMHMDIKGWSASPQSVTRAYGFRHGGSTGGAHQWKTTRESVFDMSFVIRQVLYVHLCPVLGQDLMYL